MISVNDRFCVTTLIFTDKTNLVRVCSKTNVHLEMKRFIGQDIPAALHTSLKRLDTFLLKQLLLLLAVM